MILNKIGYGYNDITIIPEIMSNINSRSEINPFLEDDMLPIFASPMSSIVDENNCDDFIKNKITPILPRNIDLHTRVDYMYKGYWVALSLNEFRDLFVNIENDVDKLRHNKFKVCIDIANGHMQQIYDLCKTAKHNSFKHHYNVCIMIGNIANPLTYKYISDTLTNADECVVDYVRCGIGSGSGCITSSNTAIHYPMASLINDIYRLKITQSIFNGPKIVADGGIRNYNDVIKALALGADYVMIGSLFASCVESCGDKYIDLGDGSRMHVETKDAILDHFNNGSHIVTEFYGMASARGQIALNGKKTKTSEGITKYIDVTTTLQKWTTNMRDYLRSAMSYCNSFSLRQFIGHVDCIINSANEINAVNK